MKNTDFRTFLSQSSQNIVIIFPIELFFSFVLTENKTKQNIHFLLLIRELGNENHRFSDLFITMFSKHCNNLSYRIIFLFCVNRKQNKNRIYIFYC